jgi:hypothetical protein
MLTEREQKLVNWLRTRKVATMQQLQHQFQVCHMTVFRALKKSATSPATITTPGFTRWPTCRSLTTGGCGRTATSASPAPGRCRIRSWPWQPRLRPVSPPANWKNACRRPWRICSPAWSSTAGCSAGSSGTPRRVPEPRAGARPSAMAAAATRTLAAAAQDDDGSTRRLPGPAGHRRAAADDPEARRRPRAMGPATSNARPTGDGRASSPSARPLRVEKKTTELSLLALLHQVEQQAREQLRQAAVLPADVRLRFDPARERLRRSAGSGRALRRRAEDDPPDRGQPATRPVSGCETVRQAAGTAVRRAALCNWPKSWPRGPVTASI